MSASNTEDDERRREELRKAGQEYFDKVLQQASKGKDPFAPSVPSAGSGIGAPTRSSTRTKKASRQNQQIDSELQAVGSLLDKAKFLIAVCIFICCSSSAMIFSKMSLAILPAPATILLLHQIPISFFTYVAGSLGLWELQPLSLKAARAAVPYSVLHCGMALTLLCALEHMHVETVIGVTTVASPALHLLIAFLLAGSSSSGGSGSGGHLPPPQLAVGGLGLVAACLCLAGEESNTLPAAGWLVPWFIFMSLEWACESVQSTREGCQDISLVAKPSEETEEQGGLRAQLRRSLVGVLEAVQGKPPVIEDEELAGLLDQAGATQAQGVTGMTAANRLFYSNALPILPVGLLAVLFQEGSLFTDAELHVHSVSMLGYSVLASTGLALSALLLASGSGGSPPMLSPLRFTLALAGSRLITLFLVIQERDDALNLEGLVSAMVCVLAGTAFQEWPFKPNA